MAGSCTYQAAAHVSVAVGGHSFVWQSDHTLRVYLMLYTWKLDGLGEVVVRSTISTERT